MGMTISEKILARASGRTSCSPGEIVEAKVDVVMLHDVGTTGIQDPLQQLGVDILHAAVQYFLIRTRKI